MTINDVVNKNGSLNYATIGGFKDRLDGHDSSLVEKASQSDLGMGKKNLGIAINLSAVNYSSDYNLALEESRALQVKGVNGHVELVCFITVDATNVNSTTFNLPDIANLITPFMQYCQSNGVKISLFKIHLITEGNSTTHLPIGGTWAGQTIAPTSGQESTWFVNYETAIKSLVSVSIQYGCTNITINNENQSLTTNRSYVSYYQTLINNVKTTYPTARIGMSLNDFEQRWFMFEKTHWRTSVADYLDFVAFNMYPHMDTNTIYQGSLLEMQAKTLIRQDVINLPRFYHLFPDKDLYVSECGSMGRSNSLFQPIDGSYSQPKNNTVQQIYIQHVLNEIASKDYIKGFYIWHAADPFTVFGTGAESIISDFYGRWNNL